MRTLDGRGAVVTGGSRGIGRAIVQRLAADGATVVFTYARATELAAEVERAVRDADGRAYSVPCDLAADGAVEQLMAAAQARLDDLDILVNNAAGGASPTPIADTDDDQVMKVNAKAAFQTMRYAARNTRDNGRIVNISSLNTIRPASGIAPYAASKGPLEQLTKIAAAELGGRGITVNAVCPGATDTDLLRSSNPAAALENVAAMTPLGRLGRPEDIADVVAMLMATTAGGSPVKSSTPTAVSADPLHHRSSVGSARAAIRTVGPPVRSTDTLTDRFSTDFSDVEDGSSASPRTAGLWPDIQTTARIVSDDAIRPYDLPGCGCPLPLR